jgi:uncharacterized protein (DUF2236 family)
MSVRFRRLLSQDPNGIPPWLEAVASGDEPGLYLPTDAPWVVHADFGTLVGGIRALLMQALHPGTLRGVAQHSRYKEDPLGRLAGTIRWLTVTTFGSHTAVANEASRVNRLHTKVTGSYQVTPEVTRDYRAADPDLLLWVHIAFMDSFLTCHQMYAWRPIPGGADNYIAQWSKSVEPLGLTGVPMTKAALVETIDDYLQRGLLRVDDSTRDVVKFIQYPPLPGVSKYIYRLLFQAAVLSLEPEFRVMLGLKAAPRWLIQPTTRFVLRTIRFLIGPESAIEDSAVARLKRIGVLSDDNEPAKAQAQAQ